MGSLKEKIADSETSFYKQNTIQTNSNTKLFIGYCFSNTNNQTIAGDYNDIQEFMITNYCRDKNYYLYDIFYDVEEDFL